MPDELYCYPGSNVLKNKMGIRDMEQLHDTVKVGESIYYSLPVVQYSPKASAGVAYRKFAKGLISYEG